MNEATIVFVFATPLGKATAWKSSESSTSGLIPTLFATSAATARATRVISAAGIVCGGRFTPSVPFDASNSRVKSVRMCCTLVRTAASGVSVLHPGSA